jgi:prevent-host-death family protein
MPTLTRIPLAEARASLRAIVERVRGGSERFIIEQDGLPVAALIDIDEFEDYLELNDPEVNAAIAESREDSLAGRTRPAGELLREVMEEEERERRLEKTLR